MEQNLYQLLVDMGLPSYILAVLLLLSILVRYKTVRSWIYKNLITVFYGKTNLNSHYLFLNEEYYYDVIDNIDFQDEHKNWLFKTLLKIKSECVLKLSREWVKDIKKYKFHPGNKTAMRLDMGSAIKNMINCYEYKIFRAYTKRYGYLTGYELYNKIYHDSGGFKEQHEMNIQYLMAFIDNLHIYERIKNKKLAFMFLGRIETALFLSIDNLSSLFKEFDGELLRIIEKGKERKNSNKQVK